MSAADHQRLCEIRLRPRRITTGRQLAGRLAEHARRIRSRYYAVSTDADETLADTVAQQIVYGLFSAALARQPANGAFPLPSEMFPDIGQLDLGRLGADEVIDTLHRADTAAVVRDFRRRRPGDEAGVNFYELFLEAYDPSKRLRRGVFYTPRAVVSYIVRSVHEVLQADFGLADGLADVASRGDVHAKREGTQPPGDPAAPFVQILDPAAGTGAFLIEVINVIHRTMTAKWKRQGHDARTVRRRWNEYVPGHLLPRLRGCELMPVPCAVARANVALKLLETGYRLAPGEGTRITLGNALESCEPATVILGNPPYAYMSANMSERGRALVEPFRFVDGRRIVERGALVLERALQDDYVKFFGLAFRLIEAAGAGVVCMISNAAYLSSPHHRGMRAYIREHFDRLLALHLHGDSKRGGAGGDENVFDIKTGVAVTLTARRAVHESHEFRGAVADLRGTRRAKEEALSRSTLLVDCRAPTAPEPDLYRFDSTTAMTTAVRAEYGRWPSIADLFPLTSVGIKTNRDHLVIGFRDDEIDRRLKVLIDPKRTTDEVKAQLAIADNAQWTVEQGRRDCAQGYAASNFRPLAYRPFDQRRIYYHPSVVFNPRPAVMTPLLAGGNLALLTNRRIRTGAHAHFFVADKLCMAEMLSSADNCNVYPLWLDGSRANLSPSFMESLARAIGREPHRIEPRAVFEYVYAVFHSPRYRGRYAELLQVDFPRVPLPPSSRFFDDLAHLGHQLVALHLMESPRSERPLCTYTGTAALEVEKVGYADGTVWLDKKRTRGFARVPEAVWRFRIGNYQVCEKWLKDRRGRTLSEAERSHYPAIVVALQETIRLMNEIDALISARGGWPGAFA